MVCDMLIGEDGEQGAYQFYRPRSARTRASRTRRSPRCWATRAPEASRAAELVPHLLNLHDVYALAESRQRRGAIDFETTKTQIICDDNAASKRSSATRNDAHKLIEEAMLAANVCAADFIALHEHPCAVSRARGPDAGKEDHAAELPEGAGPGAVDQRRPKPASTRRSRRHQGSRGRAADPLDAAAFDAAAIYTPKNSGHFGLAYQAYAHFTSPIRRYPDCWCTA